MNYFLTYFIEKNAVFDFDRYFFDTRTVFKYPGDINTMIKNYYKTGD